MRTIICLLTAALSMSVAPAPQPRPEPFVPAGIWYGGGSVQPPMTPREPAAEKDAWRRDLEAIRTLGFNSVTSWVDWTSAEKERGSYTFEALEQLLSVAGEVGLRVILHVYTDAAPAWLGTRYTDARIVTDDHGRGAAQPAPGFCADHPGVRGDRLAFIGAATRAASGHRSFFAVELSSHRIIAGSRAEPVPGTFCRCPHTMARLRGWTAQRTGSPPAAGLERALFEAETGQADLKDAADAARRHGAHTVAGYPVDDVPWQDAWRLPQAVDYHGTRLDPGNEAPRWSPAHLMWALDRVSRAAGERGWWLGELQSVERTNRARITAADLRVWAWASYMRGARAISHAGLGVREMAGADGRPTDRAKAAGEIAGNLTRNVRLFAPMRPRPSRVALVNSGQAGPISAATTGPLDSAPAFYRAMFEQNIQTDIIRPQDLLTDAASKYGVIFIGPVPLAPAIEKSLTAYARDGGTLLRDDPGDTPPARERMQRLVASAGVAPDIRIDGAAGLVEARFLESADAFLLVAINHGATPQTVTMQFTPDTPEAIWQNIETGASVHFVQRADGPTYRHAFAARDVIVLVRGKRLR